MLQLLSPAGLWALAALAMPLAIHLWRPPPQTVRLGSLRFLDNLPHRRLRNLRWRERALLAVRLGLLTALALLLAGPHWRQRAPAGPQRWALLDSDAAVSGDSAKRLDQLRRDGYTVHRLAPGFSLSDTAPGSTPPADPWSLLREADAALPAGSALAVFTPSRLAVLHGARPALRHCRVEWITTPDSAGTAAQSWIESLRVSAPSGHARQGARRRRYVRRRFHPVCRGPRAFRAECPRRCRPWNSRPTVPGRGSPCRHPVRGCGRIAARPRCAS